MKYGRAVFVGFVQVMESQEHLAHDRADTRLWNDRSESQMVPGSLHQCYVADFLGVMGRTGDLRKSANKRAGPLHCTAPSQSANCPALRTPPQQTQYED